MTALNRSNLGLLAVLLLLTAGSLVHAFGFFEWGIDDAYVSYRYAKNLADGHGLVFNPGEYVEGYSNFLYVLLVAFGLLFVPADQVYFFSLFINIAFILGALVLFHNYVRRRFGPRPAFVAGLLFALCPLLWEAVASGLETPLMVFICMWILTQVERLEKTDDTRSIALFCLVITLSVLARADGFVTPAIALFFIFLKGNLRATIAGGVWLTLIVGLFIAWRYYYYGYPLPNTYYVKVAGSLQERAYYAFSQLTRVGFIRGLRFYTFAFVVAASVALYRMKYRYATFWEAFPFEVFLGLAWLCYWFWMGGDVLGLRFLVTLVPLGIASVIGLLGAWRPNRFVLAAMVAVLLVSQAGYVARAPRYVFPFVKREGWTDLGFFLRQHFPDKTIAVDAAGKIPYYSGLYTIDMLGLADEHVAHLPLKSFRWDRVKYDAEYVLSRKPDLIMSWIDTKRDLAAVGMPRSMYEQAGYELAYLVSVNVWPKDTVSPAGDFAEDRFIQALQIGFNYAVLKRHDVEEARIEP